MLSLPLYRQSVRLYNLCRGKEEHNNYAAFFELLMAPFKMASVGFSLVGVVLDSVYFLPIPTIKYYRT